MNKLYRRNNNGVPTVWWAELDSGTNSITVFYGLIRGNIRKEVYAVTQKDGQKELESRYNDKIKQGYTYLNELCDMQGLPPVEDGDNDRDVRYINYVIDKSTMADAIESYIKDLDCTTIYPDGSRPRQTINYGYRITLSSIEYILDKLYLVLEHHPEKAQSYIDYRNSIIKRIIDIHEKNLDFERRNPVRYYSKEPRKRTRSASRVNQSKDVFTGKPIDVSTGIAKAIKPKKETIAQRKAKLLGGKAVSFAFNSLKISEHNE